MLKLIWGIVGPLLLKLAISMGLPEADKWMKEHHFSDGLRTFLMGCLSLLVGKISDIHADESTSHAEKQILVGAAVREAVLKLADHVVAGPSDLKKE